MAELAQCRVAVLVLGDIGRSPRMQYHALSLAAAGAAVELIAYQDTLPRRALLEHPGIRLHRLPPAPLAARRQGIHGVYLAAAGLRLLVESWRIFRCLGRLPKLDWILVQTPPAIPTLALTRIAAWRHRARVMVDWHNLGHTMLALRLGADSIWVGLARRHEYRAAGRNGTHLAVSGALAKHLRERMGQIPVTVHYDSPDSAFRSLGRHERRRVRRTVGVELGLPEALIDALDRGDDAPLLVVTATSWTADEDFDLLLEALQRLDAMAGEGNHLGMVFLAAGQGPGRATFDERVRAHAWRWIYIASTWVSAERYPDLLAAADLGVCLHRSSSGLDLPMKLADMWGAGLPVLALNYGSCLLERLPRGHEALLFDDARELCELLRTVPQQLPELRRVLRAQPVRDWDADWRRHVLPQLLGEPR